MVKKYVNYMKKRGVVYAFTGLMGLTGYGMIIDGTLKKEDSEINAGVGVSLLGGFMGAYYDYKREKRKNLNDLFEDDNS